MATFVTLCTDVGPLAATTGGTVPTDSSPAETTPNVISGVRVMNLCPSGETASDANGKRFTAAELGPTRAGVLTFGSTKPTFGGSALRLAVGNDGIRKGVVIATFTDEDLSPYAIELSSKKYGGGKGLVICRSKFSDQQAAAIVDELRNDPRVVSVARDGDIVAASLRTDQLELAAELQARYGDGLTLIVGRLQYPNQGMPAASLVPSRCGVLPIADARQKKLRWKLPESISTGPKKSAGVSASKRKKATTTNSSVPPIEPLNHGTIASIGVSNSSRRPIVFTNGVPVYGYITRRDATDVIAFSSSKLSASSPDLELVGTRVLTMQTPVNIDSCRTGLGWTLPPGNYSFHAAISLPLITPSPKDKKKSKAKSDPPEITGTTGILLSPPVPLVVSR